MAAINNFGEFRIRKCFNSEGELYGFSKKELDGSIKLWLDFKKDITIEFPLHLICGNIFLSIIKETNPLLYLLGTNLITESKFIQKADVIYSEFSNDEKMEEALSLAISEYGREFVMYPDKKLLIWLMAKWKFEDDVLILDLSEDELTNLDLKKFCFIIVGSLLLGDTLGLKKFLKKEQKYFETLKMLQEVGHLPSLTLFSRIKFAIINKLNSVSKHKIITIMKYSKIWKKLLVVWIALGILISGIFYSFPAHLYGREYDYSKAKIYLIITIVGIVLIGGFGKLSNDKGKNEE